MKFSLRETFFDFEDFYSKMKQFKGQTLDFKLDDDFNGPFKIIGFEEITNDVDSSNPGYEVMNSVIVESTRSHEKYNITYHNLPDVVLDDNDIIFSKDFNRMLNYQQCDNRPVVNLQLNDYGPIMHTIPGSGEFHTYSIIDDDKEIFELNKKINDQLNFILTLEDRNSLDAKSKEELHHSVAELVKKIEAKNDGSFILINDIYPLNDTKHNAHGDFSFLQSDFYAMENDNDQHLIEKGSEYYCDGDYKNAFPYYLTSALLGNVQAISNLGYCFMYGRHVEKNFDLALACFTIAANHKNIDSCYKLATIYRYNQEYKDIEKSKRYYLKAFQLIKDNSYYNEYASLCFNVAKEKIKGEMFEKDLFGAYLLLLIAKEGYTNDLAQGFTPHKKQYDEVLLLLEDKIFDSVKSLYEDGDEFCYVFSVLPLKKGDLHRDIYLKLGDAVITLSEIKYEDLIIPVGTYCRVCDVAERYVYIETEMIEDDAISVAKTDVKLIKAS